MKRWVERDNRDEVEWEEKIQLKDGREVEAHCIFRAKLLGPDHTGRFWDEGTGTLSVYVEEEDIERDGQELGCTDLPAGKWGVLEQEGFERLVEQFEERRAESCQCA